MATIVFGAYTGSGSDAMLARGKHFATKYLWRAPVLTDIDFPADFASTYVNQ